MATVHYQIGFTRNMGDFESLRIDTGLTGDPIGEETTEQAYNRIKDFVESRFMDEFAAVEQEVMEIRKGIRSGKDYERKVKSAAKREEAEGK